MSRNGSGVYSLPSGSIIVNGDTSDAEDLNVPLEDIEADLNTPRPIVAGGTGAGSVTEARANLGIACTQNVAQLIADTSFAYLTGTNRVTAGNIIQTRTEGFSYQVAASDATNHDIITAGGVKLYALPTNDVQVNIAQFGAVGSDSTKDTAAFVAFRAWALRQTGAVTLNLEQAKTYLVADPYWPRDILTLTVNGNGATIKNSATVNVDKSLLNPAYGTDADGLGTFYTAVNRYALGTTTVGALTVTTSTAAHAGNFAAGDWVMIASFDLQFEGQPPNYRFFEYHRVSSVDAGTGVVTLETRVKYAHQSNFPYVVYSNGDGRAHIYKIEQGSKWGINHIYNDITFALNDVSSGGATSEAVYCQGRRLTFNRCVAPEFLPSVAQKIVLNDCTQTETAVREFDKLVDVIELNGCVYRGRVDSATSINAVVARGTTFASGYRLCPKRFELIDCSVQAAAQDDVAIFGAYGRVDDLIISGGQHQFLPTVTIGETQTVNVTIGSGGVTWTAGTQVLYVPLDNTERRQFGARLYPGAIISTVVTTVGSDFSAGNFGTVKSVTGAADSVSAVIDWIAAPAGTEKLVAFSEPTQTKIDTADVKRDFARIAHKTFQLRDQLMVSSFSQENIPSFGRVVRVMVDVKRAYTGATAGNVVLDISNVVPSFRSSLALTVDLKTAGRRERTLSANSGWTGAGGETAAGNLTGGGFTAQSCGNFYLIAPAMASANNSELAVLDILIEFESPYSG